MRSWPDRHDARLPTRLRRNRLRLHVPAAMDHRQLGLRHRHRTATDGNRALRAVGAAAGTGAHRKHRPRINSHAAALKVAQPPNSRTMFRCACAHPTPPPAAAMAASRQGTTLVMRSPSGRRGSATLASAAHAQRQTTNTNGVTGNQLLMGSFVAGQTFAIRSKHAMLCTRAPAVTGKIHTEKIGSNQIAYAPITMATVLIQPSFNAKALS